MMALLATLVPDEALPMLVAVATIGAVLGFIRPNTVFGLLALMTLFPLLAAVVISALGPLGAPMLLLLVPLAALAALRAILGFFIGARASDHVIGKLAYDLLKVPYLVARAITQAMRR